MRAVADRPLSSDETTVAAAEPDRAARERKPITTETETMALKAGFIGYAFMGQAHSNALNKLSMFFPDAPDVERHVIVGRNEDAVQRAADQFGFANTATDWEDVLEEVDVLYNLTPNHVHAEPSIAALERDVNVLCEKPFAPTLEEAEAMAGAAEESDAVAAAAFNYRYCPAIQ